MLELKNKGKFKLNRIKHAFFHITTSINPRPISALGHSALGLILQSRVDTGCDMEKGMYYSLYYNFSYYMSNMQHV